MANKQSLEPLHRLEKANSHSIIKDATEDDQKVAARAITEVFRQDTEERKKYAFRVFIIVSSWLAICLISVVILQIQPLRL